MLGTISLQNPRLAFQHHFGGVCMDQGSSISRHTCFLSKHLRRADNWRLARNFCERMLYVLSRLGGLSSCLGFVLYYFFLFVPAYCLYLIDL